MFEYEEHDEGVGRRVATVRKLRNWRQRDLAAEAGISLSMVKKVEAGHVPASPSFVSAAARALSVTPAELLGQPYRGRTPQSDRVHAVINHLHRELAAYAVPPVDDAPPQPLDALAVRVETAAALRHQVRLTGLGEMLPDLLADLRRAACAAERGTHTYERAYGLLAETYAAASQVAYKLGYTDLASLAVDRYEWAAERSGDVLAVCVGDYQRAGELMNVAEYAAAQQVLDRAQRRIEDELSRGDAPTLSTWGNLALKQGLVAARAGQADAVWGHYAVAVEAAERLGVDRDDYRLQFGPTNVAIWGVGLATELGDADTAVERGNTVKLPAGFARERVSHHHIDLARARLYSGDHAGSLGDLLTARTVAPQQTRYHPMVRETVAALARAHRRRDDTLAGFAAWLGIRA